MIIDCRLKPPYKGFLDLHLFRGFREVIFPERVGYVSPLTLGAHYYLGDRLLFGSCYPLSPMGQDVECFREMGFSPAVLEKAFHTNPARLLGLSV
jgi:hypothetical protein